MAYSFHPRNGNGQGNYSTHPISVERILSNAQGVRIKRLRIAGRDAPHLTLRGSVSEYSAAQFEVYREHSVWGVVRISFSYRPVPRFLGLRTYAIFAYHNMMFKS